MAIQPDKKIVVVGTTFDPTNVQTVGMAARFNENGTLDTTFDANGYNNNGVIKQANTVALLPNGKILVGGYAFFNSNTGFSVTRLNPDGSIDRSFDGDGYVETSVGVSSTINSIEVLPDGKIVAVGWTRLTSNSNKDIAVVRYNADGSLDTTFGSGGRVATDLGSDETAFDCAIQADGKIIAAGFRLDPLPNQLQVLVVRYNTDGLIDTSFGNNGKLLRAGADAAGVSEVAVQSDGKIIIVGPGIPPARYNSNGTLDIDFALPANAVGSSLAIQADGKIIISSSDAANSNKYLTRFNSNGTPDSSFGTGGTIAISMYVLATAIAPDGKIVITGTPAGDSEALAVARYLNNLTARTGWMDFDGDAKTDLSIYRPSVGQWWYLKSSNGGNAAAQFGTSTDKITPADFTGDGKTDLAFFRPATGEWFVLRSEDNSYYSFPFGASGDVPVVGDFDKDGKADAGVFRPSTVTWYVSKSTGGTIIRQFGAGGDVPVAADYDGDGQTDIAIFRPTAGEWWLLRSSAGLIAYQFGAAGDTPVPGDYTGDGKTDAAFWRPADGFWYVLRSENASFYAFPFGGGGDRPAPGDYDGDGQFDAAVFRPANSTWYVQKSTSGTLIQTFGQSGDTPVPSAFVP